VAIKKRHRLLNENTNALRLIDGSGDDIPGFFLDTFADRWLISTREETLDPEVQAWLKSQQNTVYWKRLDQHEKENPTHIAGLKEDNPFIATESGVKYHIHFQAGYSQGIFLDQRLNRCAALAGATTTTLDLSQVYLDWARDNFRANDMDPEQHYFCKGDTFHWLKRFARQGRKFNGIILDPPTFSRDDKGKVFRVEKDYHRLVALAHACLTDGGWMLCCTNCRKLSPRDFANMVHDGAPDTKITPLPMPEEYTGENYLKSLWVEKK